MRGAHNLLPGEPRNAALLHRMNAPFYYFALLKVFLFGLRAK